MHPETVKHVKSELNFINQFLLAMFVLLNFSYYLSISKPEFPLGYFALFLVGSLILMVSTNVHKKYPFFVLSAVFNGLIWVIFYSM